MSMLQKWATGDRTMTTKGEYDYELPNTEPTENGAGTGAADLTYTKWKAKYYSTSRERNLGADTGKVDGTTVVADTTNKWYNILAMLKFKKILSRYSKRGTTAMSA